MRTVSSDYMEAIVEYNEGCNEIYRDIDVSIKKACLRYKDISVIFTKEDDFSYDSFGYAVSVGIRVFK